MNKIMDCKHPEYYFCNHCELLKTCTSVAKITVQFKSPQVKQVEKRLKEKGLL